MLEHGGRLRRAAREHGIPLDRWLDLSTGISPYPWPMPPIPGHVWQRLPEEDDGLVERARDYYGAPDVLPVAGSQAAIQVLPLLRERGRVGVIAPGYAEHAHAWRRAGHEVQLRAAADLVGDTAGDDVVVLIQPNNPGGEHVDPQTLLNLHGALAARGGWLVVDEAFIDATPEDSLCRYTDREGLVVLRSVGKFFGMAGARAGFVCARSDTLAALADHLGPWTLSGPTRFVLMQALADRPWQARAREHLCTSAGRLARMLARHGLAPSGGTALFQWCVTGRAPALRDALAARGILVRLFEQPASLRFGLPGDEAAFARLDAALMEVLR